MTIFIYKRTLIKNAFTNKNIYIFSKIIFLSILHLYERKLMQFYLIFSLLYLNYLFRLLDIVSIIQRLVKQYPNNQNIFSKSVIKNIYFVLIFECLF